MAKPKYPVIVAPLLQDDGGVFIALVPDIPGCMSDGEAPEEAITSVRDAIASGPAGARSHLARINRVKGGNLRDFKPVGGRRVGTADRSWPRLSAVFHAARQSRGGPAVRR